MCPGTARVCLAREPGDARVKADKAISVIRVIRVRGLGLLELLGVLELLGLFELRWAPPWRRNARKQILLRTPKENNHRKA